MPSMPAAGEITQLLSRLEDPTRADRRAVLDRLIHMLYGELKVLAHSNRYRWQGRESLGTTSLVHEAYAKLAAHQQGRFQNRLQFFALASQAMRTVLIDNAKHHGRQRRGGDHTQVNRPEELLVSAERSAELIALDEALTDLAAKEPMLARIVECRCFGGLTIEETAGALEVSTATIKRRWALARAWLYRHLNQPTTRATVA